jgi:bifunctional DNA-binding transcriptional regulator/antitoxin component of YhaV-PrlF toxin-antitoxin module
MIKKTVQRSEECFIQFTEEELSSLGIKPGDKFSLKINEDDSILMQKYVSIEIDISEWSREILEFLIDLSIKKDVSVNDVINEILEEYLKNV